MGKPRRPRESHGPGTSDARPVQSAFSQLASLRDQLPAGDALIEPPPEPEPSSREAAPAKVVVRRERKGRKGKTVTRISGIGADADQWARRLKQQLGCGGGVEGDDVVLAGDLVDRAVPWLQAAGIRRVVRGT